MSGHNPNGSPSDSSSDRPSDGGPQLDQKVARDLAAVSRSGLLDYRSEALPTWCAGCGYYGIALGVTQALAAMEVEIHNLAVVSGIGCAGRFPFFMGGYGLHAVHGRALPIASGIKIARPDLTVMAVGGDGDGLGIGSGHLPHTMRRNVDITYVLFDNGIYGLTKGQSSPTTPTGQITGTHPYGNPDQPLDPLVLGVAYGASSVAAAHAADPEKIKEILLRSLRHPGFSFVVIQTPCITFDRVNISYEKLRHGWEPVPSDHLVTDRNAAMALAMGEQRYAGVYFEERRPTYQDYDQATARKAKEQAGSEGK